jgi:hypothetical protein
MINGGFNVNGLSSADAAFLDEIVILPNDSSLKGAPMTLTATAVVSGTAEVTGTRAQSRWEGILAMPFARASNLFNVSTLPGGTSGNPGPVTLSATTSDFRFGDRINLSAHATATTAYACDGAPASCPPATPAGTGTAHSTASLQIGAFIAKDQSGNAVPVKVCSSSGFNYQ